MATALAASAAYSCGDQPAARVEVAAGSASDDDSTGAGFQVEDPGLAPTEDQDRQCLNQTREALPVGLDIYVMLDTSLSMKDLLPPESAGGNQDKWTAVRKSIQAFVQAPDTKDIGVGLQYFPQVLADVPFTCSDNSDCGSAGGACSNSRCVKDGAGTLTGGSNASILVSAGNESTCAGDDDCSGTGVKCVSLLGQCVVRPGDIDYPDGTLLPAKVTALCATSDDCSDIPGAVCEEAGQCQNAVGGQRASCTKSVPCPTGGGQCIRPTHTCENQTLCKVENYATPAVPISNSPARADAIKASLDAVDPVGPTPTGPALQALCNKLATGQRSTLIVRWSPCWSRTASPPTAARSRTPTWRRSPRPPIPARIRFTPSWSACSARRISERTVRLGWTSWRARAAWTSRS